jgi:hypothetical protein
VVKPLQCPACRDRGTADRHGIMLTLLPCSVHVRDRQQLPGYGFVGAPITRLIIAGAADGPAGEVPD